MPKFAMLRQAVSGGLGVLYALLPRNIVDSSVGHDGGAAFLRPGAALHGNGIEDLTAKNG